MCSPDVPLSAACDVIRLVPISSGTEVDGYWVNVRHLNSSLLPTSTLAHRYNCSQLREKCRKRVFAALQCQLRRLICSPDMIQSTPIFRVDSSRGIKHSDEMISRDRLRNDPEMRKLSAWPMQP